MTDTHAVETAIVGGGPAGAALAARLAAHGHEVALFERLRQPRWRASGVYSSPLTRRRLAALGLPADRLAALIRPIEAMVIETADGTISARLEYEAPDHACGIDRVRLEEALLEHARRAGAQVHEAATVRQVHIGERGGGLLVSTADGPAWWRARLVVGADGPSSIVARAGGAGVATRRFRRAALTGHRRDPTAAPPAEPMAARMILGDGWYLGLAPVPDGRVNLGLVLGEDELRAQLAKRAGLDGIVDAALAQVRGAGHVLATAERTDEMQAHLPLVHRVSRAAGPGFVLVGDAAGFIDPLSGEGLHRALVSAALAARQIGRWHAGDRLALTDYDRRLRARFRSKDVVSWLLQLFLFQPGVARYALTRLARRPGARRTLAAGLADLIPASRLVDPRFHLRVLAP
ncbi:NAD(P)/FAD-dependent oxidoreductase [soil metagenome]